MSYFVYVLCSYANNRIYIGSSANPDRRLQDHNAGRSAWSKKYRPWERVLLEEHLNKTEAEKREKYLKSGWGRRWLDKNVLFDSERWPSTV